LSSVAVAGAPSTSGRAKYAVLTAENEGGAEAAGDDVEHATVAHPGKREQFSSLAS